METIRLDGIDFPIVSVVEDFCEIAASKGRCAMLIEIKDYAILKSNGKFLDKTLKIITDKERGYFDDNSRTNR